MAEYRLVKSDGNAQIFKDGVEIGLNTDIHDFGIENNHGWGVSTEDWRQIAFSLTYDVLGDVDESLSIYNRLFNIFHRAVPNELIFDDSVVSNFLSQEKIIDDL